jgi:hypothetical protein
LEGTPRDKAGVRGQELFGINSRYVDDAILKAEAMIKSQKELLTLEIDETQTKLNRAKRKLSWAERDLNKAIEKTIRPKSKKPNAPSTAAGRGSKN